MKFLLIHYIHLTSCDQLPLPQASQQLFAGKTLPQPVGSRNAFQEFLKPQSTNFYAIVINKQTDFLLAKMT